MAETPKKDPAKGSEPESENVSTSQSLIVHGMSLLEDYTSIKPVLGKNINTFEDAMFRGGLFGLPHEIVWTLLIVGAVYAALVLVK